MNYNEQLENDHEVNIVHDEQKQKELSIQAKIEALLVVHSRPLSVRQIVTALGSSEEDVRAALDDVIRRFNTHESGISIMFHDNKVQLVTASSCAEFVKEFVEEDHSGPLTRAQLETLSIIAYRGPVSRAEIEQIRGVNCSIILRNMLIRGFVTEKNNESSPVSLYEITADFLQHLGLTSKNQLPDYDRLSVDDLLNTLIKKANETQTDDDAGQEGDISLSNIEKTEIVSDISDNIGAEETKDHVDEDTVINDENK